MTIRRTRSLGVVSLAVAGAAVLGVSPTVPASVLLAGPQTVVADAALLATTPDEAWAMGGSGLPIPSQTYLQDVWERYINPPTGPFFHDQPVFPDVPAPTTPNTPGIPNTNPLFTPEGLYPLTGVKTLEFDQSVAQGVQILDSTVLANASSTNPIVVLGYSQSATISSLAMPGLATGSTPVPANALNFVLLGDPSNPDGGLLSRFDVPGAQLTIPSIGLTASGGTPTDLAEGNPFDTVVYTQEYDGYADFPKYPLNFLADLNAFLGIQTIHGLYPTLTAAQLESAVPVEPAAGYTGDTSFFMIPEAPGHLPLTDLIAQIPIIGPPLAALLEPDLSVLVNLGYGSDPDIGWSTTGANLSTPFLPWFPTLTSQDFDALGTGLLTGIKDLFDPSTWPAAAVSAASSAATAVAAAGDPITFTDIVNAISSAASSAYAALLPTADIINFLLTTLPAYDVSLFINELPKGLLDAIGMPISADVGLVTMAAGFELNVIENAISGVVDAFKGL